MGTCLSTAATKAKAASNDPKAKELIKKGQDMLQAQGKKRGAAGGLQFTRAPPTAEYNAEAEKTIPSCITMFSGCKDTQTSADVSDVTSFGIHCPDPHEKAGGACTNGLLHTLSNTPAGQMITFANLLVQMQHTLKQRGYSQIPQLSSSRNSRLKEDVFSVWNPYTAPEAAEVPAVSSGARRSRALLIGINYFGSQAQLNGCVNDTLMMRDFLKKEGYSDKKEDMRLLTDDGKNDGMPTVEEIIKGIQWLVADAKAGDSLFLHYSGHGTQQKDENGDEADGMDEAIVPCDYEKSGLIIDDALFKMLAGSLPAHTQLVALFDCCHSGTIMDLPYIFSATNEATQALESGEDLQLQQNPQFNMAFAQQLLATVAKGLFDQIMKAQQQQKHGGKGGGANNSAIPADMMKMAQGLVSSAGGKK